jgi:hypothetical protein
MGTAAERFADYSQWEAWKTGKSCPSRSRCGSRASIRTREEAVLLISKIANTRPSDRIAQAEQALQKSATLAGFRRVKDGRAR